MAPEFLHLRILKVDCAGHEYWHQRAHDALLSRLMCVERIVDVAVVNRSLPSWNRVAHRRLGLKFVSTDEMWVDPEHAGP